MAEEALGSEALEVADLLNDLGILCKYTGRLDEAEPLYLRALTIVERHQGPEHTDIAAVYHNLAGLEHARGDYAKAEVLARRGVHIRERAVAADHPDLVADKAALAAILDGAGKDKEAESPAARGALAHFERRFGEDALRGRGQPQQPRRDPPPPRDEPEARDLYERALAIKEELLGDAHPDLAPTLANLAALHAAAGRTTEATPATRRAIAILEPSSTSDHPTLVACREDRARILVPQIPGAFDV